MWRYLLGVENSPRLSNATITKPTILSCHLHATEVHLLHNECCRSGERQGNTAKQTMASVTRVLACRPDTFIPKTHHRKVARFKVNWDRRERTHHLLQDFVCRLQFYFKIQRAALMKIFTHHQMAFLSWKLHKSSYMHEGRVKKKIGIVLFFFSVEKTLGDWKQTFTKRKVLSVTMSLHHMILVLPATHQGQWWKEDVFKLISNDSKIIDKCDDQELHT